MKKYRPYLSLPAMKRIVSFVSSSFEDDEIKQEILQSLELTIFKAEKGYAKPASEITTISEKLGVSSDGISKELYRLQCFNKWRNNSPMSEEEKKAADTYRFENGFMSESEENEFLSNQTKV